MKRTIVSLKLYSSLVVIMVVALTAQAQESKVPKPKTEDEAAIAENVKQMETGWNNKSGALFAKPFAADADYVVINGLHIQGQPTIERGHQQIFDTIYKNTSLTLTIKKIRFLKPDVALVHVIGLRRSKEEASKEVEGMISMVMVKMADGWKIVAFHNTQVDNSSPR